MQAFRSLRSFIHEIRHGNASVPLFYLVLTGVSFVAYYYLVRLPQAHGVVTAWDLVAFKGNVLEGLRRVWFIFAWGFGIQFLIQLWRMIRLKPREADLPVLFQHGLWISANAGFFEEIIFRVYAFLSSIIVLKVLDGWFGGFLEGLAKGAILPVANWVSFGVFQREFTAGDWALGVAVIVGGLFFRSAHVHYGKLSKANVWVIGMIMFWLVFNYGLVTAIIAHFLYDLCVFTAVAIVSPLQRRAPVVR